jgi:uncharacterized repeat protein (TIGR01451 family)
MKKGSRLFSQTPAKRAWFSILVVSLSCLLTLGVKVLPSASARQQPDEASRITPTAWQQISELVREKESRNVEQQKIDSQLLYAMKLERGDHVGAAVPSLKAESINPEDGKVVVDISCQLGGYLLEDIGALGGEVLNVVPGYNSVRARVPLDQLEAIARHPQVVFIQPKQEGSNAGGRRAPGPLAPSRRGASFEERASRVRSYLTSVLSKTKPIAASGSVSSEGDTSHKAALARATFGVNGTGIKIGVLSDGVTNLFMSQGTGNVGQVTVLPGQAGAGDEGTAMLEIVHDLAPGAQLYFASALPTITQFAENIRALRAAGCDIIVDDFIFFVETPFQDGQASGVASTTNGGVVIEAVNSVTADGALFFSAAFNEGNLNDGTSGCWEGDFADGGTNPTVPGGRVHNFGGGAQSDLITVSTTGPILLFWSDPLGGSSNDYDLFILNNAGTAVVAASTNIQNGNDDPFERVAMQPSGRRIVVLRKPGAQTRGLHITAYRGRLEIGTEGQTHGHSSAANAFSVAATPVAGSIGPGRPAGPFPAFFSSSNVTETFSNDGPRRLFFKADGTPFTPGNLLFSTDGGLLRQKPDITAADGVSVTGVGLFGSPFFGTSAAAPHAAAIAAMLKSANPAFTNDQIRSALTSTAIDIEAPGVDRDSGAGIIVAVEALEALGITSQASVDVGTVTAIEDGNGNGFIQAQESGSLLIQLKNSGVLPATGIIATLTSLTPGVVVTTASSTYPDLPAGIGAAVNTTPFGFTLAPDIPCNLTAIFALTLTYTGGPSPKVVPIEVQTGLPPIVILETLDSTPPAHNPAYTAFSGLQSQRLNRDGILSSCGFQKNFPGVFGTGTRRFDAYRFQACSTAATQCVTVTLTNNSADGTLFSAAYSGNFNPNNLANNHVADAAFSFVKGFPASYSFTVKGGSQFIVVVNEVNQDGGLGNNYRLSVSGACSECGTTDADLAVSMDRLAGSPSVGDVLTYRLVVRNLGPSSAPDVTLTDVLRPDVVLVGVSGANCDGSPTIVCDMGTIDSGESKPVRIQVRAQLAGVTTNSASVTSNATLSNDPNLGNNSVLRSITIRP